MENAEKRRIVVKAGSNVLTTPGGRFNSRLVGRLAEETAGLMERGHQVIFVTSAAVAMGKRALEGYNGQADMVDKQMLAATGQITVIGGWERAFRRKGIRIGQYLLSEEDIIRLQDTDRSPKLPLVRSLERGVVGIVNANDSVNTYELSRLPISADNDRLALFVARMVNADTLIFLTQKAGVLDKRGRVIPEIKTLTDLQRVSILGKSEHGTGGIESKIEVATDFTASGLAVIARGGERLVLTRILAGESVGTRFYPL